jgi:flagellar biosynthesis/type III secretory pathway chaperone
MTSQQPSITVLQPERDLWVQLLNSIQQAHVTLLAQDFKLFSSHIEQQSDLCAQLRSLAVKRATPTNELTDKESFGSRCRSQSVSGGDCRASRDFQRLIEEIERVRAHVRHANLVQAALLRRAGRRARSISNLAAGETTTYNRPFFSGQTSSGK